MIRRRFETEIVKALQRTPAVVLIGPRQVGKTTLALQVADHHPTVYIDLEKRLDARKVSDIRAFHSAHQDELIILDEVQRMPDIFTEVRSIIDEQRRAGRKTFQFLFLGSASLELLRQSAESLAGRISILELHPVDMLEFSAETDDQVNQLWLRGGFPESLLAKNDEDSFLWRQDFILTYLERDIPQLGPRMHSEMLFRFWTMLANLQGSPLNAAPLSRNLDVSQPTIRRYLDLLSDLLLLRLLPPWHANLNKRLIKSPRVYIRDSGITHTLLQIQNLDALLGHPVQGGSWEGFIIENILSVAPPQVSAYYYRTAQGAEIDLVLEISPSERWAIEIKRSSIPTLSKGFHIAAQDIAATRKLVIYAGQDSFPMDSGTTAMPCRQLMQELLEM
jgi:predicted AAA+ superfamily ATPase